LAVAVADAKRAVARHASRVRVAKEQDEATFTQALDENGAAGFLHGGRDVLTRWLSSVRRAKRAEKERR
jgi:hypothetical protein